MMPPNITPATPLVCIGITICVITQRVSAGLIAEVVTHQPYFFFDGAAGFFAAFAVSILRLIRALSLAWLRLRFIFGVWRLSPRPMSSLLVVASYSTGRGAKTAPGPRS